MTIGERLRGIIGFSGMSIKEFSEKTGIPYRTIQDYLADKRKPGADQLALMAQNGIDVLYVLSGRRSTVLGMSGDNPDANLGVIGGNVEFTKSISEIAFNLTDSFHARHIAAGGDMLMLKELHRVASYYLSIIISISAKMQDHLIDLGKRGVPINTIVEVITGSIGSEMDAKAYKVLGKAPPTSP